MKSHRLSNRGHFSPISAGPSFIAALFAAFVAWTFFRGGAPPGTITLWLFALVIFVSQIISLIFDGMTPLNFPGVALGFVYSIFLIKSLLGHFVLGNVMFYLLPVLIVLLIIQATVG